MRCSRSVRSATAPRSSSLLAHNHQHLLKRRRRGAEHAGIRVAEVEDQINVLEIASAPTAPAATDIALPFDIKPKPQNRNAAHATTTTTSG
jgi:hypothetical protein